MMHYGSKFLWTAMTSNFMGVKFLYPQVCLVDEIFFMQMLGNVGGYARTNDFNKDIDVVVVSNYLMDKFKAGEKDEFFQLLEDAINGNNTPYRKLKFTTESLLLDYLKDRANGRIRQNQKDLKAKDNTEDLNERIQSSISKDELMLSMIKKYKDSAKELQEQSLF